MAIQYAEAVVDAFLAHVTEEDEYRELLDRIKVAEKDLQAKLAPEDRELLDRFSYLLSDYLVWHLKKFVQWRS